MNMKYYLVDELNLYKKDIIPLKYQKPKFKDKTGWWCYDNGDWHYCGTYVAVYNSLKEISKKEAFALMV